MRLNVPFDRIRALRAQHFVVFDRTARVRVSRDNEIGIRIVGKQFHGLVEIRDCVGADFRPIVVEIHLDLF